MTGMTVISLATDPFTVDNSLRIGMSAFSGRLTNLKRVRSGPEWKETFETKSGEEKAIARKGRHP